MQLEARAETSSTSLGICIGDTLIESRCGRAHFNVYMALSGRSLGLAFRLLSLAPGSPGTRLSGPRVTSGMKFGAQGLFATEHCQTEYSNTTKHCTLTLLNIYKAAERRAILQQSGTPSSPLSCASSATTTMSYAPRPTNTYPSTGSQSNAHSTSNTSSSLRPQSQSQTLLQTRINAKRAELENLRHLRNLSATLATQLSTLEQRLGTLKDGAQSVALVLANWDNVLKAISMAASRWLILFFCPLQPSSSGGIRRKREQSDGIRILMRSGSSEDSWAG